jgi:hypothetical protein
MVTEDWHLLRAEAVKNQRQSSITGSPEAVMTKGPSVTKHGDFRVRVGARTQRVSTHEHKIENILGV